MKLIVVSNPKEIPEEHVLINGLFASGVETFHLRKPSYSKKQLINLVLQIDPQYRDKLVLHDHHSLAGDIGTIKIHFSEEKRLFTTGQELKQWRAKKFTMSTSIHRMKDYQSLFHYYDYAFFGPVFKSISKPGYGPATDLLPLLPPPEHRPIKLIAIGGITPENLSIVKQAGFDGAAMLGAIWRDPSKAAEIYQRTACA